MRPRTRLAVAVVAVTCCATVPAGASSTGVPVTLTGTVTLTGGSSFVRDVIVPEAATYVDGDTTVRSAGGRYSGFLLRRNGDGLTTTIAAIRPGHCLTKACTRPAWDGTWVTKFHAGYAVPPGYPPDRAPVAPGRYRIYLITDGAPVTVTLRFRGLSGKTTIRSGRPFRPTIDVPKPSHSGPPPADGHLYAAGATHDTDAPSTFRYYAAWKFLYGPPKSVNQTGICSYDGDPPRDSATPAFQYPCGGAAAIGPSGQWATGAKDGPAGVADQYVTGSEYFGIAEDIGHTSLGGYVNSPGPASAAHTTILWVDFQ